MSTKRAAELVIDIDRKKVSVLSTVGWVGKFFEGVCGDHSVTQIGLIAKSENGLPFFAGVGQPLLNSWREGR